MKDDVEIEVYLAEQKVRAQMRKKYEEQLARVVSSKDALLAQIVSSKNAEIERLKAALAAKA